MATVRLDQNEAVLHGLVGAATLLRGREHVRRGDVLQSAWSSGAQRVVGLVRDGTTSCQTSARLVVDAPHHLPAVEATCSCSCPTVCAHAIALVLDAGPDLSRPTMAPDRAAPVQTSPWELSLVPVLGRPAGTPRPSEDQAQVALQFDLVRGRAAVRPGDRPAPARIDLRPVRPGRGTAWVRSDISWSSLAYMRSRSPMHGAHIRLLGEMLAISTVGTRYYGFPSAPLALDSSFSRRVWDLLAEAQDIGLPLVQADKAGTPVTLYATPARATLEVDRCETGLTLTPQVRLAAGALPIGTSLLVGARAHGIAWWGDPSPERAAAPELHLAPLSEEVDESLASLLRSGPVHVPAHEEARFLRDFYPALRRRVAVVAGDPSVDLPQPQPAVLALTVQRLPGHRTRLAWNWVYTLGDSTQHAPLRAGEAVHPDSDHEAEADILGRVEEGVGHLPAMWEATPAGPRLLPEVTLDGMSTIRFLEQGLPALQETEGVAVTAVLDASMEGVAAPHYEEVDGPPDITFAGEEELDRDWFDLSVSVSVGGEQVPFHDLFLALAHEEEYFILPSGTYFSLRQDEFTRLASLIAEARALDDTPAGSVRLSRFQVGLWEELEKLGVVRGQALAWQESVHALTSSAESPTHSAPPGLQAILRPYQLGGFNWLTALYSRRLGGVLADDMGLGKTLQALALICHLRAETGDTAAAQPGHDPRAPFLVVAPASVVFNWAAEVARFAPDLVVRTVGGTHARRGESLRDLAAGADVVVTSYTLFRLEYDGYEELPWAALILDEAQFVKNHQSQSYRCAKKLPVAFKLAITGTPMENNLMELWSLLSITAPGLFPDPRRFGDYYRRPIEKGQDPALLDQLRRRIAPLMLRRTKQQVLTELPDKQEQVLELELNSKHQRVYQIHLQRERQKVLGLLGDFQKHRFEILRSITLLRQASLDAGLIDPKYAGTPSTKLDALMELLEDIVNEGHRTLIFSQFTRFLSAAQRRLEEAGISSCYLDGSTHDRGRVIDEFKRGSAPVFLISLKAGGFGLNLTEADYCILLDPWWNPATEAQAIDRVHRMGQSRKVMVYRLIAKDTIEEKVRALSASKAALFESVMSGEAFASGALTESDIRSLLE